MLHSVVPVAIDLLGCATMPILDLIWGYAVLTDERKKVADQLIGMDCGAM